MSQVVRVDGTDLMAGYGRINPPKGKKAIKAWRDAGKDQHCWRIVGTHQGATVAASQAFGRERDVVLVIEALKREGVTTIPAFHQVDSEHFEKLIAENMQW